MLELLVSGLKCEEDYRLYRRKKNRVFSQVMALYDSRLVDRKCKVGTTKINAENKF